jgi:acyl-CoA synthetase (NDP forming)
MLSLRCGVFTPEVTAEKAEEVFTPDVTTEEAETPLPTLLQLAREPSQLEPSAPSKVPVIETLGASDPSADASAAENIEYMLLVVLKLADVDADVGADVEADVDDVDEVVDVVEMVSSILETIILRAPGNGFLSSNSSNINNLQACKRTSIGYAWEVNIQWVRARL